VKRSSLRVADGLELVLRGSGPDASGAERSFEVRRVLPSFELELETYGPAVVAGVFAEMRRELDDLRLEA
jgi:hypothetical protein